MKCPICGKHGFSNESYADICHCERKDYIKEIERLKSERAELQVQVRRWKRQYEKLKQEILKGE